MVERLRRKFIIISVSAVFFVLFAIAFCINLSNYWQIGRHADDLLSILIENDGYFNKKDEAKSSYKLPPKMSPETPFSTRFFTIKTDQNKNLLTVDTGKISSVSPTDAVAYAEQVFADAKNDGFLENYKYNIVQKDYGYLLVFVDCSRDLQMFRSSLINSVLICLIGVLAVFIMVFLFSKKAIAPVAQSYEKQKQFITNAGHELKTPLAVINANTEVLEMEFGESQWTASIQKQVTRLSALVANLISLTRMDEEENALVKTEFSLTDAVVEGSEPFVALANNQNKTIDFKIGKNISYYGDEEAIRQLVAILLDNAIKYAVGEEPIVLSLKKMEGKKTVLQTINPCIPMAKGNYDVLFERFYRGDVSHNSQTEGYGLGLSIAKSIVVKHKGKIKAESLDGKTMVFTVYL